MSLFQSRQVLLSYDLEQLLLFVDELRLKFALLVVEQRVLAVVFGKLAKELSLFGFSNGALVFQSLVLQRLRRKVGDALRVGLYEWFVRAERLSVELPRRAGGQIPFKEWVVWQEASGGEPGFVPVLLAIL